MRHLKVGLYESVWKILTRIKMLLVGVTRCISRTKTSGWSLRNLVRSVRKLLPVSRTFLQNNSTRYGISIFLERVTPQELAQCKDDLAKFGHVNQKALDQYISFTDQRESLTKRKKELEVSSKVSIWQEVTHSLYRINKSHSHPVVYWRPRQGIGPA